MFGFEGPTCSQRLFLACHSSATSPTSLPFTGHNIPKNCHCWKQLQRALCDEGYRQDAFYCFASGFHDWDAMWCYEYPGLTEEQQLSDPPNDIADPRVQWREHAYNRVYHEGGEHYFTPEGEDPFLQLPPAPGTYPTSEKLRDEPLRWRPLDDCPGRCSERGWCAVKVRASEDSLAEAAVGDPFCVCRSPKAGSSCEALDPELCHNGCGGRGTCVFGFCHCQPGYWGLGCARSRAYVSSAGWRPDPSRLRIYVYDLPEAVAHRAMFSDFPPLIDPNYLAEIWLLDYLLNDTSGVRTENPWEANLFFVPTYGQWYYGNVGSPGYLFERVFGYVKRAHPFWNLTAGRNHVAVASNDRGTCLDYRHSPEVMHAIKLVHFGQAPRLHLEHALHTYHKPVSEHDKGVDPVADAAKREFGERLFVARFQGFPLFKVSSLQAELEPCYRPEHDVVMAGNNHASWCPKCPEVAHRLPANAAPAADAGGAEGKQKPQGKGSGKTGGRGDKRHGAKPPATPKPRTLLLYFHGTVDKATAYSQGVRQALVALFGNTTRKDVSINKRPGPEENAMLLSRFCFAPNGYGWGIRLYKAMRAGCVPLLAEDHVYPPFWDVLPYQDFSVRVSRHDLHTLLDRLDRIGPSELARLQEGVAKHWRAFEWDPALQGQAYNYTLMSLHRRLLHLWANQFRHA